MISGCSDDFSMVGWATPSSMKDIADRLDGDRSNGEDCISHDDKVCVFVPQENRYLIRWVDSCGRPEEIYEYCDYKCSNRECDDPPECGDSFCYTPYELEDCIEDCTKTECVNNQCLSETMDDDGIPIKECDMDDDCGNVHTECWSGQCIKVDGAGSDECAIGSDDCTYVHRECAPDGQCSLVNSTGIDECIFDDECEATSCTDSDGRDHFIKGFVTYEGETYEDFCSGQILTEFYCEAKDMNEEVDCGDYSAQCIDGACINNTNSTVDRCIDEDKLFDVYIEGKITFDDVEYVDSCNGDTFTEYICIDDEKFEQTGKCDCDPQEKKCRSAEQTESGSSDLSGIRVEILDNPENFKLLIGDHRDQGAAMPFVKEMGILSIGQASRGYLDALNIISIGGPCSNLIAANLMGIPQDYKDYPDCLENFISEKGDYTIEVFDDGKVKVLLIAGKNIFMTEKAVYDFKEGNLDDP
jgi:hypothetical protein